MKRPAFVLATVLLVLSLALPALAQFETASVLGYVRDASAAVVAGSSVTLTNLATNISVNTKTNSEGEFDFVSVAPGSYKVAAEADGFGKTETSVFRVTTNARQRVDVVMRASTVQETVTVSAGATLLETETSSRGQVIGTQEIENLPLNGRSYADLALLAPGVRKSVLENQSNTSREQCRPSLRDSEFGGGGSNYNALQAKFEKQLTHGLYILESFTYSRDFDNAGGHLETSGGDNSRINIANIRGDYGPSGYDQPIDNTASILWDLPIFRKSEGLTHNLLDGWQFTNITTLTSGLPANLNYNVNSNFTVTGLYTYRPNSSGKPYLSTGQRLRTSPGGPINFLDKNAVFVPTCPNPFGNASRNSIRGPRFSQTDMGLHKAFQLLHEGQVLDFRTEAFNIFNESNFYYPDTNVSNGTYGQISSAFPARQLQFAVKLIF